MGSKPSKPIFQQPIAMMDTHNSSAAQVTNRPYNFSKPRPRLNLDKALSPLLILRATNGMVGRRAVGGDRGEEWL